MRWSIAALACASVCLAAQAANVTAAQAVQVTGIEGSRSAKKGYFVITTANTVAGCEAGFWLPASDSNYVAFLARVNDALVSKAPVAVAGDREQLWPESPNKICRITQLQ